LVAGIEFTVLFVTPHFLPLSFWGGELDLPAKIRLLRDASGIMTDWQVPFLTALAVGAIASTLLRMWLHRRNRKLGNI
jgi:hypothetical protein